MTAEKIAKILKFAGFDVRSVSSAFVVATLNRDLSSAEVLLVLPSGTRAFKTNGNRVIVKAVK